MKSLVIIPTYNEHRNIRAIVGEVLKQPGGVHVLIVDDNSPDGTGKIADELAAKEERVFIIHRSGKQGLGTAYVTGFKWALARDYEYIFEMDADFSHDPRYVPRFLEKIQSCDLVLGSRYTVGVSVIDWTLKRLILSKVAGRYVRWLTRLPATDATGGFKCFRRRVLEAIDLDHIHSGGYSFQIEMTYNAWVKGFRIREIPIIFFDRRQGTSKMSKKIIEEAVWVVLRLALKNLFKKKPKWENFYQPEQQDINHTPWMRPEVNRR